MEPNKDNFSLISDLCKDLEDKAPKIKTQIEKILEKSYTQDASFTIQQELIKMQQVIQETQKEVLEDIEESQRLAVYPRVRVKQEAQEELQEEEEQKEQK